MAKMLRALTLTVGLLAISGCLTSELSIKNSSPRLTWIAVQAPVDGVSVITVWIQDLEGDPVDLEIRWFGEGEEEDLDLVPGSHGIVGLTTLDGRFEPNGQPHELWWDVSSVPTTGELRLHLVPDDRAVTGPEATTPPFVLAEGLPEPVAF